MAVVELEGIFQLLFGAGVLITAALFAGTALSNLSSRVSQWSAGLLGALAAAGWVWFAFRPSAELAVSAAGLTACCAAALGAYVLRRALVRSRRIEEEMTRAESRLAEVVAGEVAAQASELERALARARADSLSLLAQEERRIADERRQAVAEGERRANSDLADSLRAAQARLEQRIASWADDLERAQGRLSAQAARLRERQKQLMHEIESRIETEAKRLDAESEQQRGALAGVRDQLGKTIREAVAAARAELETHAAERRRALHEVSERLRRRERELQDQIERQEGEAAGRIRASFADVERRQLEQLERTLERASGRHADAAAQQFEAATKGAREHAAKRLSRELDRAVATYAREAQSVLAERLTQVAGAGTQRLEKRIGQVAAGLERQRDELAAALEHRVTETEAELRRRLEALAADTEAERGVLEARLHDLARRIEVLVGRAEGSRESARLRE